ncbi:MAG: hypothetical protein JSU01_09720 [Bacteroidetes bacterium]|nr:hypothetical protein [Bacteroidota bacterium]
MSRPFLFHMILILVLAMTGVFAFGQGTPGNDADYTITKRLISIEDGLASHEVFCGLQDKQGFMWFGTRNGLNRYDGKNCLLFTSQRNHLQENKVVHLAKDDTGNLFIEYGSTGFQLATDGKVDVMDPVTQEVKTLTAAFPKLPFKEQDVYWVANDGTDEVNFLTAHPFRLWKYSRRQGFKLRYQVNDWTDKTDIFPFIDYRRTGPFCLFAKGQALLKFFNQSNQYLVSGKTVTTFRQKDALRSLPIGFNSAGDLLIIYNTSAKLEAFDAGAVMHNGPGQFPADNRQFSTEDVKGRYWDQVICSADGSSSVLDKADDGLYLWSEHTFLKIASKPDIKTFENLFLYQLFPDRFGNMWLCTSLGVLQLKIEKNGFRPYFTTKQQSVEANNQARGIYADRNRVVANIWTHIFQQQGDKMQSIANDEYNYALAEHNGTLYSGGYNLSAYDVNKNSITKYPDVRKDEIWSMFSLNDSLLLLGRTNGFSVFNSNSKKFDSITYSSQKGPDAEFVYRFFTDKTGSIWAVAENGLYMINTLRNGKCTVTHDPSPLIAGLSLLDAYADDDGIFWLATNGEGLYRWDRKANTFQQFNIAGGFPSDVLYRIEPDEYNNLWISSDYGLVRFNKKTYAVNTYTTADGITNNEFNRTSSSRAKDGQLYFGGLDGIIAFNPKDFTADARSLNVPLRIIAFNQFIGSENKLVNQTAGLLKAMQITLAPADRFFTLEFQLLDYAKDEAYHYAYKIDGVDKDWNYINENSIRISGLPYGEFILHVKAQNREGAWSKSELTIPLLVLKPFYLKWWFITVIAVLLVLAVYWIIKWRTKQLAAEKIKLEQTVSERTAQLKQSLSEQAGLLAEKDVLMKEIHHRVKNNLQVISGLLELQSSAVHDDAAKDALREGRNRVRSMALIHQNLYQFENLSSIELKRFVGDLCRQIESVFKKQNTVTIHIDVPVLYLDIDSAVPLGLIMNELLTNSFKYAFNGDAAGEISLEIHTLAEGKYELTFRDNGPGLPADFNLDRAKTLGLQLISDLSRQIGGKVKYEYKDGALFIINFTNRDFRKKED